MCILGHNVNLIPPVDCGQKVCRTVFHNPGKSVTEICLGNPLKQKAGKKEKNKNKTTPDKEGERCSVWGGGWSFPEKMGRKSSMIKWSGWQLGNILCENNHVSLARENKISVFGRSLGKGFSQSTLHK